MLSYAVALVSVALLVMLYRRDRRLLKAKRAKFFGLCLDMFQAYRVTQDDVPWVAEQLRRHGGREAWDLAARLCR